ncbi:alpha/beta hydrolase family protein [Nocardia sp. NPDC003693]
MRALRSLLPALLLATGLVISGCSGSESPAPTPATGDSGQGAGTTPARSQEPKPPWPYRSEDVTYRSDAITVAGTLTLPRDGGPHPAVLLITGSGPQNRDEELLGHKPFLVIADALTRAGYAVLRVDDRGVGGTGGDLNESGYPNLADDVVAGLTYLRSRADIDGARLGLLGHSEGGYLAPLVAARPDSGVAFTITLAGPAVPGADVVLEQTRLIMAAEGAPPERIDAEIATLATLNDLLRSGDLDAARRYARERNDALPADQRATPQDIDAQLSPYFAALVAYDPAPALAGLRTPVLALFGGRDLQVPPAQSEPPMRALLTANPDATVHTFPGLNHLMQPTETGLPSEYATIETTVDPRVLTYLTEWLATRFPVTR